MAAAKKTTAKKTTTRRRRPAQQKSRPNGTFRKAAHTVLDTVEGNIADGFTAIRATVDAKDLQSAIDVQRKYAETALKRTRQGAGKLNEIATKAVQDAGKPIVDRVKKATTRVDSTLDEAVGRAA
jgi:hypothetical protein